MLEEPEVVARSELAPYPPEAWVGDLMQVTDGRSDSDLARVLASESRDALYWLHSRGIRSRLVHKRQAYLNTSGRLQYSSGLTIGLVAGGHGPDRRPQPGRGGSGRWTSARPA